MSDRIELGDLPHYTYKEFKQWEGNWELIHGIPYAMSPAPRRNHQRISGRILVQLDEKLADCDKCEVFQPIDIKLKEDTIVQPDLSILCDATDEDITIVPVLVVEILSPSTAIKDKNLKFKLYESYGVKYYWIVEPDRQWIEVYELVENKYQRLTAQSQETFDIGTCSFSFNFDKIWNR